jgi:hypothetical protein
MEGEKNAWHPMPLEFVDILHDLVKSSMPFYAPSALSLPLLRMQQVNMLQEKLPRLQCRK